jgi:exonuclease VII small subunit
VSPKDKERAILLASYEQSERELEANVVRLERQKHRIDGALTDLKAERL